MNTVKEFHEQAMDLAHQATIARNSGDQVRADQLIEQAFQNELTAANLVPDDEQSEPTRSILYRSAGSLAFQSGFNDEAIRLIALGLSGFPPPKIKHDLFHLLDQVKFKTYLAESEQEVVGGGLLVTIRGQAVEVGVVLYNEFKKRYENAITLIDKTTQRLTDRPYKSGRDKSAYTFQKLIEVPITQNSFAVKLRLLNPLNPSLFLPSPEDVIDQVVHGIELLNDDREPELRNLINNEQYYAHFVHIAREIAPDGTDIEHVGLISTNRSASLSRTRGEITPETLPISDVSEGEKEYRPIERTGRLAYADDLSEGENAVGIELDDGKPMKIKLTEGIDDIVKQNWNKIVTVRGMFDGTYIYASDIESKE